MEDKIKQIIKEAYWLDDAPADNAEFSRLGDSLSFMDSVIDVEEEFGIKLDDANLKGITSVGEFVRYVAAVIDGNDKGG